MKRLWAVLVAMVMLGGFLGSSYADEEILIVLVYKAVIAGIPQVLAVSQPNMEVCAERATEMALLTEMIGPTIDGQLTFEEIQESSALCTRMTLEELFNFGS